MTLAEELGVAEAIENGNRGTLTQPQIDKLKQHSGFGWITALTSTAIRELVKEGDLQLSLLDRKNLAEITSANYSGERLMVCHKPVLGEERKRKPEASLAATEKSLEKIDQEVARRKKKPLTAAAIGLKVGQVLGRYKMVKHFECKIGEGRFAWNRRAQSIEQEEKLDGIYVLRTSEPAERLSAEDMVRSYKSLGEVGRAFRCLKGTDLLVRSIRHRTEDRVPAHIFLCVLAYYVEWHLRRAWAPLLFEDEERREEQAPRSDSAGATLGIRAAKETLASNSGRSTVAQFRGFAGGVGQPVQSHLRAQNRERDKRVEFDFPPGDSSDAGAGSSLRITSGVSSNRKLNIVLFRHESAECLLGLQWNFGLVSVR